MKRNRCLITVLCFLLLILITSCKQARSQINGLVTISSANDTTNTSLNISSTLDPYYGEWLEHESDTLHIKVKFLKNGEVYFNFLTRCCINLIKGTFIVEDDLIMFDFEDKSNARVDNEVPYSVQGGVVFLTIKEEPLPFTTK